MSRVKKRWEDEEIIHIGRSETRANFKRKDEKNISLNGDWKYMYLDAPEYSPSDFYAKSFDDSSFNNIEVPSCIEMKGYSNMHYTDVWYLFPINPPFVSTENPTSIYRKYFNLDKTWLNNKTIIRFEGVATAYDIWVNGEHVGYSKVSRLYSEFDISKYVSEGENLITVRVYKYSDGTYLECQDMWWFSGIFRDVILLNQPLSAIEDFRVNCSLSDDYNNAILEGFVHADTKQAKVNFIVSYEDNIVLEGQAVAVDNGFTLNGAFENVKSWSAETPSTYKIELLYQVNNEVRDSINTIVGFRKVEIKDGNFTVNGKAILLNGVNMHDFSPKNGATLKPEDVEADIIMMKKFNINAIRCSHYPKMDYFYELCSKYGLYVIDEADLETHGFEWINHYTWLNNETSWTNAYKDRIVRMVKSHYNHPCIIMWSLGNEAHTGDNFVHSYNAIKELDTSRLVHYEGDKEANVSDVYSTMYSRLSRMVEIAEGSDAHGKPHIICEYAHAMGNGPGNMAEYQELFRKYKRLQGGFIWEWYDHGIETKNDKGEITYYYGGDYSDKPNNSNFCVDGMLPPTKVPSTGLKAFKQIISPVEIKSLDLEKAIFRVTNCYDFLDLSHLNIEYSICFDDNVYSEGIIDNIKALPTESFDFVIDISNLEVKENTSYYVNMKVTHKYETNYSEKSHTVAHFQFELPIYKAVTKNIEIKKYDISIKEDDTTLVINNERMNILFDKVCGKITRYEVDGYNYIEEGIKLNTNRATIDNDMYKILDWNSKYFMFASSEQLENFTYTKHKDYVTVDVNTHYSYLSQSFGFKSLYRYTIYGDGSINLKLNSNGFKFSDFNPEFIPRIGVECTINKNLDNVTWCGLGPDESYSDMNAHALMGIYHKKALDMHTEYIMPQENGLRSETKWIALSSDKKTLLIVAKKPISFSYHDYSIKALDNAKHIDEIEKSDKWYLHIDMKHSGVGTNACGEDQIYRNKTRMNDYSMEITLKPIDIASVIAESKLI